MSNKSNRPRMSREEWNYRKGDGKNIGRFYDGRSNFIHVSQEYDAKRGDDGEPILPLEFVPMHVGHNGKPRGTTYRKPVETEEVA